VLNFLPKPHARAVRRRYAARLVAALALALGAGAAAHGLALLPAIIEGRQAVAALAARAEALRASAETREYGEATLEAAALRRDARAASVAEHPALSAAADGVIRAVPGGVSVAAFTFDRAGVSTVEARVEGVADTREALLLFRSNLEAVPGVTSVDVPVSDLARESNAAFSITVSLSTENVS
jgi:hypothetical protein